MDPNFSQSKKMMRSMSVSLGKLGGARREDVWSDAAAGQPRQPRSARLATRYAPLPAELEEMQRLMATDEDYAVARLVAACNPPELAELADALLCLHGASAGGTERLLLWAARRHVNTCRAQPETLFRATTLETKLLSVFVHTQCAPFVRACVAPLLDWLAATIANETGGTALEVDPHKEAAPAAVARNQRLLLAAAGRVMAAVQANVALLPEALCDVLRGVQGIVERALPGMGVRGIGALLFLRLLCPAMVAPDAAGLGARGAAAHSPALRRSLILVSKLVQNLANQVMFGEKEDYFVFANEWLRESAMAYQRFVFDCVNAVRVGGAAPGSRMTISHVAAALANSSDGDGEVRSAAAAAAADASKDLALRWVHNFICVRRRVIVERHAAELFAGAESRRLAAALCAQLRRATNGFKYVTQPDMPLAWQSELGLDQNILRRSLTAVKESMESVKRGVSAASVARTAPASGPSSGVAGGGSDRMQISEPFAVDKVTANRGSVKLMAPPAPVAVAAAGATTDALPTTTTAPKLTRRSSTISNRLRIVRKSVTGSTPAGASVSSPSLSDSRTPGRSRMRDDGENFEAEAMDLGTPMADVNVSPLKKHKRASIGELHAYTPSRGTRKE